MRIRRGRLVLVGAILLSAVSLTAGGRIYADTSSSAHYKVDQTQFSSGSSLQSCSTTYCSKATLGDTTVGNGKSANYSAQFGAVTNGEPMLQIIALGGIQNAGVLDTDHTATVTSVVKVRNYYSSGYIMEIVGAPPSQGTHALRTFDTPTSSHPGAEQFGINLVANNDPNVGADPEQVPSDEFSFGQVSDNYATPNLFMYHSGDTVAYSSFANGQTNYTVSMIVNVSNITAGGHYTGEYSAVVVPVY